VTNLLQKNARPLREEKITRSDAALNFQAESDVTQERTSHGGGAINLCRAAGNLIVGPRLARAKGNATIAYGSPYSKLVRPSSKSLSSVLS
jgi:hypothetical protein